MRSLEPTRWRRGARKRRPPPRTAPSADPRTGSTFVPPSASGTRPRSSTRSRGARRRFPARPRAGAVSPRSLAQRARDVVQGIHRSSRRHARRRQQERLRREHLPHAAQRARRVAPLRQPPGRLRPAHHRPGPAPVCTPGGDSALKRLAAAADAGLVPPPTANNAGVGKFTPAQAALLLNSGGAPNSLGSLPGPSGPSAPRLKILKSSRSVHAKTRSVTGAARKAKERAETDAERNARAEDETAAVEAAATAAASPVAVRARRRRRRGGWVQKPHALPAQLAPLRRVAAAPATAPCRRRSPTPSSAERDEGCEPRRVSRKRGAGTPMLGVARWVSTSPMARWRRRGTGRQSVGGSAVGRRRLCRTPAASNLHARAHSWRRRRRRAHTASRSALSQHAICLGPAAWLKEYRLRFSPRTIVAKPRRTRGRGPDRHTWAPWASAYARTKTGHPAQSSTEGRIANIPFGPMLHRKSPLKVSRRRRAAPPHRPTYVGKAPRRASSPTASRRVLRDNVADTPPTPLRRGGVRHAQFEVVKVASPAGVGGAPGRQAPLRALRPGGCGRVAPVHRVRDVLARACSRASPDGLDLLTAEEKLVRGRSQRAAAAVPRRRDGVLPSRRSGLASRGSTSHKHAAGAARRGSVRRHVRRAPRAPTAASARFGTSCRRARSRRAEPVAYAISRRC